MAVLTPSMHTVAGTSSEKPGLYEKLNTQWHKPALLIFMAIVILHWGEHLFQAYQVYVMHWPRPKALGMLGLLYPWLVTSETMHYAYALIMLIGLWVLRKGFTGVAYTWWMVSFWIQFWHHIEHFVLLYQATTGFMRRCRIVFCRYGFRELSFICSTTPLFLFRWSLQCTTTCTRPRGKCST